MSILAGYIVPHPPLLVGEVGAGKEKEVKKTAAAYERVAVEISKLEPSLIIFITPHSVIYQDYFHVSPGDKATGSFGSFGAPQVSFQLDYDKEFSDCLCGLLEEKGISGGTKGEKDKRLDHGVMVPMYFINKHYTGYKGVRIAQSGMDALEHYRLGMCIAEAAEKLGRKTVIVASGDLSHKLTEDGPYGLAPEGAVFDDKIVNIIKTGNFLEFMTFDEAFCNKAAECGLRSFIIMAGAMDRKKVRTEFLSYEGPFGVGYGVGAFYPEGDDLSRNFLDKVIGMKGDDPYIRLAKLTLECYIANGTIPNYDIELPEEMIKKAAGIFVCIKKDGALRGCIGTIAPVRQNIAAEIMYNAVSAGVHDNRFSPVEREELPYLTYSVDVLEEAETIPDMSYLDVKEYGCIVTNGMKRGLLLPNLEGVDTVEEQVAIAMHKGGINPKENYQLERFKVVRHE